MGVALKQKLSYYELRFTMRKRGPMGQETIKELRNQNGWSQSDLSSLTGLSVRTIQRMENGKGAPSMETAKALASVFNRPFSDFLSSIKTSTQHTGRATPKETASSPKNADMRMSFFHKAETYWRSAFLIIFVATLSGFLTKTYLEMAALSANTADIALLRSNEPASSLPANFAPTASAMQEIGRDRLLEFAQYYGGQSIRKAFQLSGKPEGAIHMNLFEMVMLMDVAIIVSRWEEIAGLNSDLSAPTVLKSHLQCYGESRAPSDSVNESIAKITICIRGALSDAYWELNPAMDRALMKLALTMREMGPALMWEFSRPFPNVATKQIMIGQEQSEGVE